MLNFILDKSLPIVFGLLKIYKKNDAITEPKICERTYGNTFFPSKLPLTQKNYCDVGLTSAPDLCPNKQTIIITVSPKIIPINKLDILLSNI